MSDFSMHSSPLLWFRVSSLAGRVGKTSILLRYVENTYDPGCPSTLQASYLEKHIIIEELSSNRDAGASRREAQLSIWDTAGQERFHSLGPIYYRDAKGAILVYDVTDRPSFERVRRWTKELRKMVGDGDKICISIVGNKIDLQDRAVDTEEVLAYAHSVGAASFEVSAKTGR
jgi:Ras-related protein Rab-21